MPLSWTYKETLFADLAAGFTIFGQFTRAYILAEDGAIRVQTDEPANETQTEQLEAAGWVLVTGEDLEEGEDEYWEYWP